MEAPEVAQQLHREQLYNPDYPLDMYALGLLLLEMAGGRLPAGHCNALQQAHRAGPLQGPAFTQKYARSLCLRAPPQTAYKDMVIPQALLKLCAIELPALFALHVLHVLVRNSGISTL